MRFTRVVEEFAVKTQFVIVTHNKMTMRCASNLYGVTMQEQGVSKIVSVRFDDVDEKTGKIKSAALQN
jgi:chromosome segregation protein